MSSADTEALSNIKLRTGTEQSGDKDTDASTSDTPQNLEKVVSHLDEVWYTELHNLEVNQQAFRVLRYVLLSVERQSKSFPTVPQDLVAILIHLIACFKKLPLSQSTGRLPPTRCLLRLHCSAIEVFRMLLSCCLTVIGPCKNAAECSWETLIRASTRLMGALSTVFSNGTLLIGHNIASLGVKSTDKAYQIVARALKTCSAIWTEYGNSAVLQLASRLKTEQFAWPMILLLQPLAVTGVPYACSERSCVPVKINLSESERYVTTDSEGVVKLKPIVTVPEQLSALGAKIRWQALQCITYILQTHSKILFGRWPAILSFRGIKTPHCYLPTLLAICLNESSKKVRHAAVSAVVSLIDNSTVRKWPVDLESGAKSWITNASTARDDPAIGVARGILLSRQVKRTNFTSLSSVVADTLRDTFSVLLSLISCRAKFNELDERICLNVFPCPNRQSLSLMDSVFAMRMLIRCLGAAPLDKMKPGIIFSISSLILTPAMLALRLDAENPIVKKDHASKHKCRSDYEVEDTSDELLDSEKGVQSSNQYEVIPLDNSERTQRSWICENIPAPVQMQQEERRTYFTTIASLILSVMRVKGCEAEIIDAFTAGFPLTVSQKKSVRAPHRCGNHDELSFGIPKTKPVASCTSLIKELFTVIPLLLSSPVDADTCLVSEVLSVMHKLLADFPEMLEQGELKDDPGPSDQAAGCSQGCYICLWPELRNIFLVSLQKSESDIQLRCMKGLNSLLQRIKPPNGSMRNILEDIESPKLQSTSAQTMSCIEPVENFVMLRSRLRKHLPDIFSTTGLVDVVFQAASFSAERRPPPTLVIAVLNCLAAVEPQIWESWPVSLPYTIYTIWTCELAHHSIRAAATGALGNFVTSTTAIVDGCSTEESNSVFPHKFFQTLCTNTTEAMPWMDIRVASLGVLGNLSEMFGGRIYGKTFVDNAADTPHSPKVISQPMFMSIPITLWSCAVACLTNQFSHAKTGCLAVRNLGLILRFMELNIVEPLAHNQMTKEKSPSVSDIVRNLIECMQNFTLSKLQWNAVYAVAQLYSNETFKRNSTYSRLTKDCGIALVSVAQNSTAYFKVKILAVKCLGFILRKVLHNSEASKTLSAIIVTLADARTTASMNAKVRTMNGEVAERSAYTETVSCPKLSASLETRYVLELGQELNKIIQLADRSPNLLTSET